MRRFKYIISIISIVSGSIIFSQSTQFDSLIRTNKTKIPNSLIPESLVDSVFNHKSMGNRILRKQDDFVNSISFESKVDSTVSLYGEDEKSKTVFIYDQDQEVIERIDQVWKNKTWENSRRTLIQRDKSSYSSLNENFNGTEWVPDTKYETKYDDNNQMLSYQNFRWNEGWILKDSEKNEYLPSGKLAFRERNYVGYLLRRYEYKYNVNNEIIEHSTIEFYEDGIENRRKEEYQYNIDGFSNLTIYYIWENRNWLATFKDFRNYIDNKFTNSLSQDWISGAWQNYQRTRVNYNEYDVQILYLSEYWIKDNWVNSNNRTKLYNANNDIIEHREEKWLEGKWELLSKSTFNYDSKNNLIFSVYLARESNMNSFDIYKYEYGYDTKNNRVYISTTEIINDEETYNYINTYKYDKKNRRIVNSRSESFKGISSNYNKRYTYYNDAELKPVRDDHINTNRFSLLQNYPNPFNPNTTISFIAPQSGVVTIRLYNNLGQKITTLTENWFPEGMNFIYFNSSGLSSGAYFYRLEADGHAETKKMIILK